jgi:hypothetical protein
MTFLADEVLVRRLGRRAFLRGALALTGAGAATALVGCGGGDDEDGATPAPTMRGSPAGGMSTQAAGGAIMPVMLTSEFVVGQRNRFLVGLLNEDNDFLRDAQVALKFYVVNPDGESGKLRGEGPAAYTELVLPEGASAVGSQLGETIGFYEAIAPFDLAGKWAVEISATPSGASNATTIQAPLEVFETYRIPAPGTLPPASENDTAATNPNEMSLCSRDPICSLHDKVIADYLGKGRPLVVQFSTPAFCDTRFCGPVLDVLLDQYPDYEDRAEFIHIEVWQDFQLRQYRAATQEWGLPTEPITFFMRADGTIASFLESVFTVQELTAALDEIAG